MTVIKIDHLTKDYGYNRGVFDISTDAIFHGLFTAFGGFFVTRFVLLNNYDITNEDIDQLVRFIMDGIRKHS